LTVVVLVDTLTAPGTETAMAGALTSGGVAPVDAPEALPSRAESAAVMLVKIGFATVVDGAVRRCGTAFGSGAEPAVLEPEVAGVLAGVAAGLPVCGSPLTAPGGVGVVTGAVELGIASAGCRLTGVRCVPELATDRRPE
jgi:hypothetical protein